MMTRDVAKDVLQGVVITNLLYAAAIYIPVFGIFCAFLIPLPIAFYRSKLGRKVGSAVPIAALAVMTVLFGRLSIGFFFFVELLLIGFIISELFELNLSIEKTVLY